MLSIESLGGVIAPGTRGRHPTSDRTACRLSFALIIRENELSDCRKTCDILVKKVQLGIRRRTVNRSTILSTIAILFARDQSSEQPYPSLGRDKFPIRVKNKLTSASNDVGCKKDARASRKIYVKSVFFPPMGAIFSSRSGYAWKSNTVTRNRRRGKITEWTGEKKDEEKSVWKLQFYVEVRRNGYFTSTSIGRDVPRSNSCVRCTIDETGKICFRTSVMKGDNTKGNGGVCRPSVEKGGIGIDRRVELLFSQ